jgi:hypothetical protein
MTRLTMASVRGLFADGQLPVAASRLRTGAGLLFVPVAGVELLEQEAGALVLVDELARVQVEVEPVEDLMVNAWVCAASS